MLHSLPNIIRTPLAFVVTLGVLVFFHELGHYLAARWLGFRIEAFAIGFGRPIASWKDRAGTSWQIGWLPLGGFVRLYGFERPETMDPEARALMRPGEGFHDRHVAARALVTAAGPIANFLLTFVLFTALIVALGRPVPIAVVGEVTPNSAAARAGLQPNDKILTAAGVPTDIFADLQRVVLAHPGTPIPLHITRGATTLDLTATPDSITSPNGTHSGRLGIGSGAAAYRPVGPLGAVTAGAGETWFVVVQTAQGLWQVISGQRSAAELGGTLRIAQLSGQVAAQGFPSFVNFIAVLSINLGLLNLVPIPILDGGHLVFYALEALRGRPLPARAQEVGMRLGFGLVVTLVAFTVINDLTHMGLFRWIAHM